MIDRRGLRLTLLLAAVALGIAACGTSTTPTASLVAAPTSTATAPLATATLAPSPTPVPEPTPVGTTVSVAAPCEPSDLKASHDLVDGAAGSRTTSVVLVSAIACSVEAFPAFAIRDANGAPVIAGVSGGPGRIDLRPEAAYETQVRATNWCGIAPRFPLTLELIANGQARVVTGTSFPEDGDLPPCNGAGSGPVLEANAWQVQP